MLETLRHRKTLALVLSATIAFPVITTAPVAKAANTYPGYPGCDLTGKWDTSFGSLRLHQKLAPAVRDAIIAGNTRDEAALVFGTYQTREGDGHLDGNLVGDRLSVHWL